jgi:hypothetical protein
MYCKTQLDKRFKHFKDKKNTLQTDGKKNLRKLNGSVDIVFENDLEFQ